MKILLLGPRGQLGWQLQRSLSVVGEVVAADRAPGPLCGNLASPGALRETVQAVRPDAIVNAAAYTAVDKAEDEREAAFAINAVACEVLAQEAEKLGAWLVHYSSDYVFDGSGENPRTESDATGPLGVYGASKLAGEQAVQAGCPRHLVLRTSWVFDTWGGNFLKTILRAAATRDSLKVVADQWGAPTRAALLADATAHALLRARQDERLAGLYHLAAGGTTTWHGYASLAVGHAAACGLPLAVTPDKIAPVPSSDYPVKARRPANSRLDTGKFQSAFGLKLPPWEDGVRAVVAELAASRGAA